jgi:hypothetical protein
MPMEATFEITNWDEKPVEEWTGGKLTRATVSKRYSGDIEGDAVLEYVMAYAPDGTAEFVGVERVTGRAGGRNGALVLRQVGRFDGGAAKATLTVVGGTDDFAGATGDGTMVADPAGRVTLDLA